MQKRHDCEEFELLLDQFLDDEKSLSGIWEQSAHAMTCGVCYELMIDYQRLFQGAVFSSKDFVDPSPAAIHSKRKLIWSVGPSIAAMMLILIGMSTSSPLSSGQFEDTILAAKPAVGDYSNNLVAAEGSTLHPLAIHRGHAQSGIGPLANLDPFGLPSRFAESGRETTGCQLADSEAIYHDYNYSHSGSNPRMGIQSTTFSLPFYPADDLMSGGITDRKRLLAMTGTHPFFIDLIEGDRLRNDILARSAITGMYSSLSVSPHIYLLPPLSSSVMATLHWLHQSIARGWNKPSAMESGWDSGVLSRRYLNTIVA